MPSSIASTLLLALTGFTPQDPGSESFEQMQVGVIDGQRRGRLGTWRSDGAATISTRRAKTGKNALRILGGERRTVTLHLRRRAGPAVVGFWAERWTRRPPFDLRMAARIDGRWRPVFHDTGRQIVIGGYRARVKCTVDKPFDALRWTCTSAPGGGLLLDDLAITTPRPMRIVSVTTEQPVLPVLVGNDHNPIARVRIDTTGDLDPLTVEAITWTLASSGDLEDVASAQVLYGTSDGFARRVGSDASFATHDPAAKFRARGERRLAVGANFFWLSVKPRRSVDLDGWIDAGCVEVRLAGGRKLVPKVEQPGGRQRFGIAVRKAGADGVANFRIPGITTTRAGTLVAVYDIRRRGGGDLPGDIDVGMSRSTDGGRTWQPMRVILDMGDDPKWRYDGVGDPAILYDDQRDTLWVAATWSHGNRSWRGSGPGLRPEETGQLMLTKSTDDGRTWSAPINITKQVKDPAWSFVLQSPGRGITMANGTLVFGAQYQDPPDKRRTPYSTILFSNDHGESWHIGTGAQPNTTECQPVEITPGVIMLNMRDNRRGLRSVLVTRDMGKTWQKHQTHRKALIEPTCNAGLLAVRRATDAQPAWLAFVNPAVKSPPRRRITLKLSTDGGASWPASRQIPLDSGRSAGYPSLTMIDAETIGVFYEGSRALLTFQRIRVDDL